MLSTGLSFPICMRLQSSRILTSQARTILTLDAGAPLWLEKALAVGGVDGVCRNYANGGPTQAYLFSARFSPQSLQKEARLDFLLIDLHILTPNGAPGGLKRHVGKCSVSYATNCSVIFRKGLLPEAGLHNCSAGRGGWRGEEKWALSGLNMASRRSVKSPELQGAFVQTSSCRRQGSRVLSAFLEVALPF